MNQIASTSAPATLTYDGRGNLTSDGTKTFGYDVDNRLTSASGGATLSYDPGNRLYQTASAAGTTRFLYDGQDIIGEYNGSSALQRRFVHGPGDDEPLVWVESASTAPPTTSRKWLAADQLGSVVAVTDSTGASTSTDTYDDYGVPGAANIGRFQYTGQAWIPELALYDYKARMYSPALGRFVQPDPIGYDGGLNLYAYVGNDPINADDPSGLGAGCTPPSPASGMNVEGVNLCGAERPTGFDLKPILSGFVNFINAGVGAILGGPANAATPQKTAPKGFDVPVDPCSQAGKAPSPQNYEGYARALGAFGLPEFRRSGLLDAQPYGATRAYGNYAYGVYLAAIDFSLPVALSLANTYAGVSRAYYDADVRKSYEYPNLPAANVQNISNGYRAKNSGTACRVKGK